MLVQREYEPLCVFDGLTVFGDGWQFVLGSLGIDRQYRYVIARPREVTQHFVESIGVAGNVREGRGLDEERDVARRRATEGRDDVDDAAVVPRGRRRGGGGGRRRESTRAPFRADVARRPVGREGPDDGRGQREDN